jgi:hypothetical protein
MPNSYKNAKLDLITTSATVLILALKRQQH